MDCDLGVEYAGGNGKRDGLDGAYAWPGSGSPYGCHPRHDAFSGIASLLPAYHAYGLAKFKRFAENVWNVDPKGKSEEEIAEEGLAAMEAWMKEIGVAMNIRELGVTEEMLDGLVSSTLIMEGGYKVLKKDEILEIFQESM